MPLFTTLLFGFSPYPRCGCYPLTRYFPVGLALGRVIQHYCMPGVSEATRPW